MRPSAGALREVTRPPIPFVAWFAASFVAGVLLAEWFDWQAVGVVSLTRVLPAAIATALAIVAAVRAKATAIVVIVALGTAGGALSWQSSTVSWEEAQAVIGSRGRWSIEGLVVADAKASTFGGHSIEVVPRDPATLGPGVLLVAWPQGSAVPEIGQVVRLRGSIEPPRPESERDAVRRGTLGFVRPWKVEVLGWAEGLTGSVYRHRAVVSERLRTLDGMGGVLLEGILLGDRRRLRGTFEETDLRVCGLSHLLAVSGLHVGIVAIAVSRALVALRVRPWGQSIACATCCLGYAALTGFQPSTGRALVMVCLAWTAKLVGRRGDALAAVAIAVLWAAMRDPTAVFDLSLTLSASAVIGLIVFADLAGSWLAPALPLPRAGDAMAVTLVAQSATAPLILGTFKTLSLVAPLANLFAMPLVSLALGVGMVGALTWGFAPGVGASICVLAARLLDGVLAGAALLAGVPGASVALDAPASLTLLIVLALASATYVRWPTPRERRSAKRFAVAVLAAHVVVGVGWPWSQPRVEVLDVGQADAILIRDGTHAMLVDAAARPYDLIEALGRTGVRRLDAVVLTHAHDDHVGGFAGLAGVAAVGWVGAPVTAEPEKFAACAAIASRLTPRGRAEWRWLASGDSWTIGGFSVRVLWPDEPRRGRETNDTSVVLLLEKGDFQMVLGGDAEKEALDGIGDLYGYVDIDVIKLPHHGSKNGLTARALAGWSPEVSIASVGEGNRFGHPSPELATLLAEHAVDLYRTDTSGDVSVRPGSGDYAVAPARSPP